MVLKGFNAIGLCVWHRPLLGKILYLINHDTNFVVPIKVALTVEQEISNY